MITTSIPKLSQRHNTVKRWCIMVEDNRIAPTTPNDAKTRCNEGFYNRHGAETARRKKLLKQTNTLRISFATSSILLLLTYMTRIQQMLVNKMVAKPIGDVPLDNVNVKNVLQILCVIFVLIEIDVCPTFAHKLSQTITWSN
jgi:hypothetical protein